ncbi:hypothetical protein DEO72_LG5g3007 [Vigna unguiculata]|uniref:Uncharacterized protein n=1 Tax=Vigna unguiculata TaxID=3917 RepID=A0A4D6M210_VIGUN|nr:hypothetical protein DEO72_LG5g3007 [Vigna unguiculata]
MAKLLDHHSLADHEDLAHLLPSTKLMIIARRTATYITNMQQNGNQTGYDSSFNTLRLDSTHPDTYNLVGFSGCLHLCGGHGITSRPLKRDPGGLT